MDIGDKKGKEKMEEKKVPVFFKGVLLVDLDDSDVSDNRLHCDSDDSDDDNAPKPKDMDVSNGGVSNLQCLEPNTGPTAKPRRQCI